MTCFISERALATEAILAFEQNRLRRREAQVEGKFLAPDARVKDVIWAALQHPIVEHDGGIPDCGLGAAESFARGALVVQESANGRVGDRSMGEEDLLGGKSAWIALIDGRPETEKG